MNSFVKNTLTCTSIYANILKKMVNWSRFFQLVKTLGSECNSRKDRFDKADIFEQSIEVYSNNKLKWVDGIGVDHIDVANHHTIEFKYQTNGLLTNKGIPKKKIVIKIKNSLGTTETSSIREPSEFYMFAQQNAVALISYRELEPHLNVVGDGISTNLPGDKLTWIYRNNSNNSNTQPCIAFNYMQKKRDLQRALIESIE
jgi:hypothetical protein